MNAGDDQVGFLVLTKSEQIIVGVTIDAGQFIVFKMNPQGGWIS
jgi:hypothetical protein